MRPELSRMNPPVALFRRQVYARWLRDRTGSSQPAVTEAVLPLSSPTFITVMDMLAGKLLALRLCGPTIVNSILSISIILITKFINGSVVAVVIVVARMKLTVRTGRGCAYMGLLRHIGLLDMACHLHIHANGANVNV